MAREVKKKKNSKGTGRDLIKVDWEEVIELCQIQCTQEEISSVTNISVDTLDRASKRENNCTFAEFISQKRLGGHISLRRKQFSKAVDDGSDTMLIWLGKNYLDQKDKIEASEADTRPIHIEIVRPY